MDTLFLLGAQQYQANAQNNCFRCLIHKICTKAPQNEICPLLWGSHLTDTHWVPPQLSAGLVTAEFGAAHLVFVQPPFLSCILVQSPLQRQPSSPVSHIALKFQSLQPPAFRRDCWPPAQLSSSSFCPLVCCPRHSRKYWTALEAELQGHSSPSWKSEALIITLDYGTSTCVTSAWWLCLLPWEPEI